MIWQQRVQIVSTVESSRPPSSKGNETGHQPLQTVLCLVGMQERAFQVAYVRFGVAG